MRKGCAAFGVSKWSDVFMRDGKALRHEMRDNGELRNRVVDRKTGSEWVMRAKVQVLVESNEEGRAKGREYRMCRSWRLLRA
jgi:hypothetical protein